MVYDVCEKRSILAPFKPTMNLVTGPIDSVKEKFIDVKWQVRFS